MLSELPDKLADPVDIVKIAFANGFKPDPVLTVSEWADQYRILSSVASSAPGQWRTDRTPYLREVMDCLSPSSRIQRVSLMFGSQLGKTEAGLNWSGFVIHNTPGPMLMVQPTVEMAKRYSKQRVDPMIKSTPEIRAKITPSKSRDSGNTMLSKEFPGGIFLMTGANSPVGLSSTPIRFLFMDEVDRFPPDAEGEGDPVSLAVRRTNNFPNRKILLTSTPTIKDASRIEHAYLEGDQRKYYVPCPECGHMQTLEWKQIKWPKGKRRKAYCECVSCGHHMKDYQKTKMLENGEWRATANCDDPSIASFHLSSLYSPNGWLSWGDIAVEHGKVYKDPPMLKTWVNTMLSESWEDAADRMDGSELFNRREKFGKMLHPAIVILTAGVDVQDDRLEVEVVGWGADQESWSVGYWVLHGDPSTNALWDDLDMLLAREFPHSKDIPDMRIDAVCLDTGGHHTQRAYSFCRPRWGRNIWAIKGKGGMGRPVWPRKPSRNNTGNVNLFSVGVDSAKETLYARLRIVEPGPGYCHFSLERDESYFNQLTAESVKTRFSKGLPIREWVKKDSVRNEALDVRVYATAALEGRISAGYQLNKKAAAMALVQLKPEGVTKHTPKKKKPKRRVHKSEWMS